MDLGAAFKDSKVPQVAGEVAGEAFRELGAFRDLGDFRD
jgi:hypothetical protein